MGEAMEGGRTAGEEEAQGGEAVWEAGALQKQGGNVLGELKGPLGWERCSDGG